MWYFEKNHNHVRRGTAVPKTGPQCPQFHLEHPVKKNTNIAQSCLQRLIVTTYDELLCNSKDFKNNTLHIKRF